MPSLGKEKQCPLKRRGRDTVGISVPRIGRENSGQSLMIVLLIKLSFHVHRRTDIKLECESQGMWSSGRFPFRRETEDTGLVSDQGHTATIKVFDPWGHH